MTDTTADGNAAVVTTDSSLLFDGTWWFHIRTVDNEGNWSAASHLGPFPIDGAEGTLWYFAEGYTGDGWETRTFLLNDGGSTANVSVTYLLEGGGTVTKDVVLAPESRTELLANNAGEGPGNDAAFGMRIVSDQPITAQQSLLDTGAGFSHGSAGSKVLSTNWYFAEGFTGPGWLTFYLRHKPQRHRRQCHR